MNTYVYKYIYISRRLQLTGRQGEHRRLFTHTQKSEMETLPEAHGRSTEQSQPPENLRKNGYGEWQRRRARSQSGSTSSSLTRDTFSIPLPLFYSPRREAVIIRYIILILCPFGQRYTSILSLLNACYLGFHLSRLVPTYLLYNEKCARV